MEMWQLAEPSGGILLTAERDGVYFRAKDVNLSDLTCLNSFKSKSRLGRLLPVLIPQLLELDIAIAENDAIKIPHTSFVEFEDSEIDAFDNIVSSSPFALEIYTTGTLGASDFKYIYKFYLGREPVHLDRIGCFVRRGRNIYRLDKQTFTLAESIETFNALSSDEKKKPKNALLAFANIKGLSESLGADIDDIIASQKIIIPSKVGLDFTVDNQGGITFVPKIDGISEKGMIKAFLAASDVNDSYYVETSEGGRVRVLLNESQKEVLRRMQKVQRATGEKKAKALSNPYMVFDGVADSVDIDLESFGPRVKGIGDFPFVAQPYVNLTGGSILDDESIDGATYERGKFEIGIKCRYVDGSEEDVVFKNRDEIVQFYSELKLAQQNNRETIVLENKTIRLDNDLVEGVENIVSRVLKKPKDKSVEEKSKKSYLLIYTNENELEYNEDKECREAVREGVCIPNDLKENISLKDHQIKGLEWLQVNYRIKRKGCLLADEMGLGKTLQVLSFLAWLIRKGDISPEAKDNEIAPWNPILIIAPVMLLETETWLNDMRTFFKAEGEIFQPHNVLHGAELKKFRKPGISGRETEIEESALDLDKLRQYRVILTNYETITNYQFSFAKLKEGLSVIVTDEAQEYKTPNTKISHALKSLSPQFRIACTGTPVETRLIDVWNIFDFLQPGRLGSASEFSKEYERPIVGGSSSDIASSLAKLREKLHYGKPYSLVLRRDKGTLSDLPQKFEHKETCALSEEQKEGHIDFVSRARAGGEGNHHFSMIHQLMRLYQHPLLLFKDTDIDKDRLDEVFKKCPKLEKVMDILGSIKKKREKALIFTRSLDMQQILAKVIYNKFNIGAEIINGGTSRKVGTRNSTNTRKDIIKRFRNSDGFNVLILSPDVAGVGLTLTEANHVIHYGRWWNPAKESQATDRVYRIGQTRDVHVYYPIARDPSGTFKTFDEKLDTLLQRRKELSADFLAPIPDEEQLGKELWQDIVNEGKTGSAKPLSKEDIRALPWDRFESLIALLEEKNGNKAILTPKSGDYGIDVISTLNNKMRLIQCKHTIWGTNIESEVIDEMINAIDLYRGKWLRSIVNKVTLKLALVTNGKYSQTAQILARQYDIQLIDGDGLWKLLVEKPCSLAEVEATESCRTPTMRDVLTAVNRCFP